MELHQLRYFVAVADEGSFSRAAAKVRVAQPSLSQQIRKLEAEIGQPLFDRLPRSVVLTEAGRCLLEYARQILASIGDARRSVDELKGKIAGDVAVGAIPTIAPYVLPELVVTFQKHYPNVTLHIVEDVTEGIARRIEAGELDVALASTCQKSPTIRVERLGNVTLIMRDGLANEVDRILALEGRRPARDVNALDEVPCSTWYCPRNHLQPLSRPNTPKCEDCGSSCCTKPASTLSVGIVIWAKSYSKLLSRI